MVFWFLGLIFIAVFVFISVMTVYFVVYKWNINKAVAEKDIPHIRMVPPYKIVVLLSVIILLVIVYILSTVNTSHGSVGVTSLPLNEYLQEVDTPEIDEWIVKNTHDDNKAYILQNRNEMQNKEVIYYLVYVPYAADNSDISVQQSTNLFGETVTLNFEATDGNRGNMAVLVTYVGSNNLKIKINYGGQTMDYVISEVEYSLDLK